MIKDSKQEMIHLVREILPNINVIAHEHQYKRLQVEEIGTGNINYIYRIKDKNANSVIVKYAQERARISKDMILSPARNYWEAMIMKTYQKYNEEYVPEIYDINSKEHYFVMEDIRDSNSLKEVLAKGHIVPNLINSIQCYFKIIIDKIDVIAMEYRKLEDIQLNNLDLMNLTEHLVFQEPYYENSNNSYAVNNKEYVYSKLYNDKEIQVKAAQAKKIFRTQKTTLIHGDLHTGSIMILNSNENIQVHDYEFAMFGPLSYDIGNLLAHLTVSYICNTFQTKNNTFFLSWMENVIGMLIDLVNQYRYLDNNNFAEYSEMFCACELIRRSVGIAKFNEVHSTCPDYEAIIERICIELGRKLLLQVGLFQSTQKYINAIMVCMEQFINT